MERPGDWQCPNPNCVNHTKMVFGSRTHCPKCNTAQGDIYQDCQKATMGMQGGDMPGDWMCPNVNCINNSKLVFGRHPSCPRCGTARNAKQPGDWVCPNQSCINSKNTVFASKPTCPKCGHPRPGTIPQAALGYFGFNGDGTPMMRQMVQMGQVGQMRQGQPSDWQCPNSICVNHSKMVFGKNSSCPKCGSPKPAGGSIGGSFGGLVSGQPGDWQCPNASCQNNTKMVFAKHTSCPKCGSPKPTQAATLNNTLGAMGATMGGAMGGAMGGMGGVGGMMRGGNPGDWQCPDATCMNHAKMVFAKHTNCPQCGLQKPSDAGIWALGTIVPGFGGSAGQRGQPGDWRCPNTDCINHRSNVFARHTNCPKCGAEKPVGNDEGGVARSRSPHRTPAMQTMLAQGLYGY